MHRSKKLAPWFLLFLILGLSACNLPMKPTPGSALTNTLSENTQGTSNTEPISLETLPPTATVTPPLPAPSATFLPTVTRVPTKIPTAELATPTQESASTGTSYGVILINQAATLSVHSQPYDSSSTIENLDANATGLFPTGKETKTGSIHWLEINTPSGTTGWVDGQFLTEIVPAARFSTDPSVKQLLASFEESLNNKDGKLLASLISPVHGLYVQEVRGGAVIHYDAAHVVWVFESTYAASWGLHPGSGLPVKGSFAKVVYPDLMDVFSSPDTQVTFESIATGGTTYTAIWPKEYSNINFVSEYRPGPAGKELDWRTWLVGIEYSGGKPYLFALNQLSWEP